MKKITMIFVALISIMLTGCMLDKDTVKNIEKDNLFNLSFNEKDISGSCNTHIIVKKEGEVVLDEKEKCLKAFNITFQNNDYSDNLVSLDIDFSKNNIAGKTSAWFNIVTLTKEIKTYVTKDEQNMIEVPRVTKHINTSRVNIEYGKPMLIEQDGVSLETIISY